MRTWTEEETEILRLSYNLVSNEQLYKRIPNKSPLAIYKKAYKMGLRKDADIEFLNRSNAKKGEKAWNWNGGSYISKSGYRLVLCRDHPRADSHGYVFEHILVWERESGMALPAHCCIHHLNGNKTDNRIENLCMMLHKAHTIHHHSGRKRSEETKAKISAKAKTRKIN